jgi:hypothetical protein
VTLCKALLADAPKCGESRYFPVACR